MDNYPGEGPHMTATQTRTPTLARTARPPLEDLEPLAGVWGYRLAVAQAVVLLVILVPPTLAVGLRWVTWEQAHAITPLLHQIAVAAWVVGLLGLILGVIGLSQTGGKKRTVRGLFLHLLFTVGPIVAALLLR
jgi:hypothetical protein